MVSRVQTRWLVGDAPGWIRVIAPPGKLIGPDESNQRRIVPVVVPQGLPECAPNLRRNLREPFSKQDRSVGRRAAVRKCVDSSVTDDRTASRESREERS